MIKNKKVSVEDRQKLIDHNRRILYRIPSKYEYLLKALTDDLRQDILQLYKWLNKVEIFRYEGKYAFMIDNKRLTSGIRKKTTESVTNRHYNFLCAIGLINKADTDTRINRAFTEQNPSKRAINTYYVRKYTNEELDRLNERARQLLQAKITKGNISKDRLLVMGLKDIAKEVYPKNSDKSLDNKETQYLILLDAIDQEIKKKGYATKRELNAIAGDREQVDNIFRIFKADIEENYSYKRPTKAEKEKLSLHGDSWIIKKIEKVSKRIEK